MSDVLLARTFAWKSEVHRKNKEHMARMLKPENFIVTDFCFICEGTLELEMQVDGMQYGECSTCNHLQAINRPSKIFLEKFYSSSEEEYSSQDLVYVDIPAEDLDARIQEMASPKVDFVLENIDFTQNDLWVDIGSGTGDVLLGAKKVGFSTLGIEASPTEIEIAEHREIETLKMFYDASQEIDAIAEAKVVSLFNVLEHVSNPKEFLTKTLTQMSVGSYIVIEVPRYNSASTVFQKSSSSIVYRHIWSPGHLNIFSDYSLTKLLTDGGANVTATWLFGSDAISLYGQIIREVDPAVEGNLIGYANQIRKLQDEIDKAGLSDVILMLARKI